MAVIPFNHQFAAETAVTDFGERLLEHEGPQILGWAITGAVKFWANDKKLPKPKAVVEATRKYLADEDWLARFLEDKCFMESARRVGAQNLHEAYQSWERNDNGARTWKSAREFKAALESRGYVQRKSNGRAYWHGIGLPP